MEITIAAGDFALRGLSGTVLGESGYACLVDRSSIGPSANEILLDDYLTRDHILVSSVGGAGIDDETLEVIGRKRRGAASTTHFAAFPYLLTGVSNAIAIIPSHAAENQLLAFWA